MAGARHGGAELFFERLCIAQHEAGDAVLPVIRRDAARAGRLRAAGLDPVELDFGGLLDLLTRHRLRRVLRAWRPRVAVTWMNRASGHMPRGDWVHVGRLGGYYALRHYRTCQHLVGNTRGIVAWLQDRGIPAPRTHYLPNFSHDYSHECASPHLASERPLLLGLGRLHTDKGFDILLRALALLPDAHLAIAGEGPERAALERLAARLGVAERTKFLGWRDDPGALLRAARVFVCSSRIEPLGNMVLDAWSAGTPVVAAASRGPAELLRPGSDGLLVPMEDPASLAGGIAQVLGDRALAARLTAAGRARYDQEFAKPPVLTAWRAFLQRVTA